MDPDDPSSAARAEARRVEAAVLLAQLVAARDTLTDFEHFASRLVQLPKGEIDDTPKRERARRLAEHHDLQRALDASTTTLRVAERLFRRLYGAGELLTAADLQALAQDYVGAHDPAVITFLERRPATVALLRDAAPVLRAHFGAGVTLHLDAGDAVRHFDEDEQLRVTVQGHGLAYAGASERLDAFHDAWALAQGETARRVSFDVDWGEASARVAPIPTVTGVR